MSFLNFGPRPEGAAISLLVVHNISLPPGEFGGGHIEEFFCNRLDPHAHPYFQTIADLQVSAHGLICRDGSVVQFVSLTAPGMPGAPVLRARKRQ